MKHRRNIVTRWLVAVGVVLIVLFLFRRRLALLLLLLALTSHDYQLDEASFDAEHLNLLKSRIGIPFPDGTRGLNLFYKDAMFDAPYYARVSIPSSAAESLSHSIEAIQEENVHFSSPTNFVSWWNPLSNGLHKAYLTNGCLTDLLFCKEGTNWVLYIKSATM